MRVGTPVSPSNISINCYKNQRSEVRFAPLSAEQIAAYCDSAEPYDKAGGLRHSGMAARFIEHIRQLLRHYGASPLETCELLHSFKRILKIS